MAAILFIFPEKLDIFRGFLAPVVQSQPDKSLSNICVAKPRYPLDSDLSVGLRYPHFEQPGPGFYLFTWVNEKRNWKFELRFPISQENGWHYGTRIE